MVYFFNPYTEVASKYAKIIIIIIINFIFSSLKNIIFLYINRVTISYILYLFRLMSKKITGPYWENSYL